MKSFKVILKSTQNQAKVQSVDSLAEYVCSRKAKTALVIWGGLVLL
jgi:hypothetical protein